MANEDATYTIGMKRLVVELKGWRICPLICYDLRFPVWCRNRKDYDLLIFVANWPERRAFPWHQLLIARAIENQCYTIGVNRVGIDGNSFIHAGDSVALNYKGETISKKLQPHQECIETVALKFKELEEFRSIFPVGMDADDFTIL